VVISLFSCCISDCITVCDDYLGYKCCNSSQTCWEGYHSTGCCDTLTEKFCTGQGGYTEGGGRCYNTQSSRCCSAVISMTICDSSEYCCFEDDEFVAACCSTTCGPNLLSCGTTCYSSSEFYCTEQMLVPIGMSVCGSAVYSSSEFYCSNEVLVPVGMSLCGSAVYSPSVYNCTGQTLVPVGMSLCGPAVYSPDVYQCFNGETLCPIRYSLCGSDICYDATAYICCNGELVNWDLSC